MIAVMETAASIDEMTELKAIVDTINRSWRGYCCRILPEFTELGEIQSYWGFIS